MTPEVPVAHSERVPERRLSPSEAVTTFDELLQGYAAAGAQAEAERGRGRSFAAASAACPFGVDVDAMLEKLAAGDVEAAGAVVSDAHPWGGIMGRCCHRFCEQAMLGTYPPGFEPINLRALERAAADLGSARPTFVQAAPSGKRVAIVGAGSGGLATALGLLRKGHAVTIFDSLPAVGGMLIVGYPTFRMPRHVLRRELPIQSPLLNLELGRHVDQAMVERLLAEYDAVCLAIGRFASADVGLEGDDLDNVYEAVDFLEQVTRGTPPPIGDTVAVLGAGYTAQDVARTARRLGARVHVLYRRGPEEMPVRAANRQKFIAMMQREGVPYRFFLAPLRIVGEGGRATGVELQPTRLGEPDDSGRRVAEPTGEPPQVLPVTAVVKAFGQRPDFSLLPDDVRVDGLYVVHVDHRSTRPRLFVVGDIAGQVGNDGAFDGGLKTAQHIDRFLHQPDGWPTIPEGLRMRAERPGAPIGGD
jgi:NADPH-dependent glutamate synthase beta subunit-like oxidoreductase